MRKLEKTLKACANVSRLKILEYLKKNEVASVLDIANATKFSYRAVSKHLGILYSTDMVEREQSGYEMLYRISSHLSPLASSILKHVPS
jgi:DNA-binding transcriptional ArsR family regulator